MTTQSLKKITLETFRNACPVVGNVCRLTSNIVGSIQNYYGQSISFNIGNLKATQCTQGPSEENFETLHSFCPAGPKHEVSPSLIK